MPERTMTENVVYYGSSVGTGYVMELTNERLNGNTGLLTGVAVAGVSAFGSMFVQNPMLENAMDGVASGSLGWVGGKVRQEGFLQGLAGGGQNNNGGATGGLRVRPVRTNRSSNNNSSNGNNRSKNVVEM